MTTTSVNDLRRIADAVGSLRDHIVQDVTIRADCRQLRVTLDDGQTLLVTVLIDENGKPRLDADLLHTTLAAPTDQIEVFDGAK